MKKLVLPIVVGAMAATLSLAASDALAGPKPPGPKPPAPPPPPSRDVPELSVIGAGSALALIAGGVLVAAGKRRRRESV